MIDRYSDLIAVMEGVDLGFQVARESVMGNDFPFTRQQIETMLYAIRQVLHKKNSKAVRNLQEKLLDTEKRLSELLEDKK